MTQDKPQGVCVHVLYVCLYVSIYVSAAALCLYMCASKVCIDVVNVSLGELFFNFFSAGTALVNSVSC